jgi:2-phosphosulfolactate phosphatase
MSSTVVIDCFPETVAAYRNGYAVVAIDVIRATTTAVTAVAAGRRCFPVTTVDAALRLAAALDNALLAGEQRGVMPPGFHLNNSPSRLLARTDIERPLVLLSSSGTRLCCEAGLCDAAFLVCLRNYISTAAYLATRFPAVAVIGAGNYHEFREEDQMCCARLAENLMNLGYRAADRNTLDIVKRWQHKPVDAWTANKSAQYLKDSGQREDLEFILEHVADLNAVCALKNHEVVIEGPLDSVLQAPDGTGRCDA